MEFIFSPSAHANFDVKAWSEKGKKLKALEVTETQWSAKIEKYALANKIAQEPAFTWWI